MAVDELTQNGWTPIPLDAGQVFKNGPYINKPEPLLVSDMHFPSGDPLVREVQDYAKRKLPAPTYNHSMRVYYYATAIIKQQFPEEATTLSPSTLAITCLLHDIGTAPENLTATHMSFDLYGGIKAHNLLQELGAATDQAQAVCEAVIRHQDLGTHGTITFLGQVIQLATIYDNVGEYPSVPDFGALMHRETRKDVNTQFVRHGWLGCFADTIREEVQLKPWCHSTCIPDFAEKIEGNELMKPFE